MSPATPNGEIRVVADAEALRRAAAEEILRTAQEVLRSRKVCTIALPGGRTPRPLYQLLGGEGDSTFRAKMPWGNVHLFWADERLVPADHPDSNYAMVREAMLTKLNLTRKQIHRIRTEGMTPQQAALEYERELKAFFTEHLMLRHQVPRFDIVLLGLGADGHVAGLRSGWDAGRERNPLALVMAPRVTDPALARVTLTPLVINTAANVIVMASGAEKADALQHALEGPRSPERSSNALRPSDGRLLWLADKAAASKISTAA
jgi:6-phosphogluconolactonase